MQSPGPLVENGLTASMCGCGCRKQGGVHRCQKLMDKLNCHRTQAQLRRKLRQSSCVYLTEARISRSLRLIQPCQNCAQVRQNFMPPAGTERLIGLARQAQDNFSSTCREVAARLEASICCDRLDNFEETAYNRAIENRWTASGFRIAG